MTSFTEAGKRTEHLEGREDYELAAREVFSMPKLPVFEALVVLEALQEAQ